MSLTNISKALGFTLMMLESQNLPPSEASSRARQLALLIEEFCALGEGENSAVHSIDQHIPDSEIFLKEAAYALELCLTCPALTWEAEHVAQVVLNKLKRGM